MHHNIYVRWSAGSILIGNFDLQTQHNWLHHRHKTILYGRRLMDTGAAVLWNFLPTALNVHRPYITKKNVLS